MMPPEMMDDDDDDEDDEDVGGDDDDDDDEKSMTVFTIWCTTRKDAPNETMRRRTSLCGRTSTLILFAMWIHRSTIPRRRLPPPRPAPARAPAYPPPPAAI